MLVFFALGNAKVLSFALGNAKLPDASSFASQWNIGFRINPGQVQNDQTFGASLVLVQSIEKVTSTREQVKKYCNWRKESYLRL